MKKHLPLIALAVWVHGTAPVQAAPFEDPRTDWTGNGKFRSEVDGPVRQAKCRVTSEPVGGGAGFNLFGKCAAPSGSATIDLKIERRSGGQIAGALGSSVIDGTIQLVGTESATGVALVSREPLDIDDQDMRFQIELDWPSPGTLTLNEWLTPISGGGTTQIVWITLSN